MVIVVRFFSKKLIFVQCSVLGTIILSSFEFQSLRIISLKTDPKIE